MIRNGMEGIGAERQLRPTKKGRAALLRSLGRNGFRKLVGFLSSGEELKHRGQGKVRRLAPPHPGPLPHRMAERENQLRQSECFGATLALTPALSPRRGRTCFSVSIEHSLKSVSASQKMPSIQRAIDCSPSHPMEEGAG
jgi:hypothetical protein